MPEKLPRRHVMANRKQNSPRRRKATTSNTLPEAADRQMIVKADAGELENTQIAKPPATRKRSYVRKSAPVAAASTGSTAMANSLPAEPVPLKTAPGGAMVMNNGGIMSPDSGFKKNRLSVLALALSGFLILFVLFFCVIPLKQVNYLAPVVYQDVETYTDQEAYLDTIPYTEKEAYTVQQAYTENQAVVTSEPYIDYGYHPWPYPSDNVTPPPPVIHYRNVVNYIPVTKYRPVTEYRDVQKIRYELKYRPVQKQRTVTKVKQEPRTKTVPMLYYLMTDTRTIDMVRPQS
jgi:hypothetical protein